MTTTNEGEEQPPTGYAWCDNCEGFGEYFWGESDNLRHAECRDCDGTGLIKVDEEEGERDEQGTVR